ncbi:class I SAM-dependent methyltransferase [Xenorhabdus thuongxuanensis]|uniref:site-specific DNA-methyltransferase (cytosine-N(4)-specific) n=1 Tax=Xenorhabdus thuongxuanensis TaxID=1873484 RepID=A0A1Q5U2Y4_9GAMM|nr:class I SAM-dependent methyltransferase [Xenorhabdus thuongxuanensis]OKP06836.1 type II DNA modification methyltransferase [Xenorhabdus thuongxuanensis]
MLERLKELDWDFSGSNNKDGLHSIHPYPAKFIPEIPEQLIRELAPKKGVILDPFCGSGTTMSVAQKMGYESIGIDLNPIACLISRVKTSVLPDDFRCAYKNVLVDAKNRKDFIVGNNIPNVDHWFRTDIQEEISKFRKAIENYSENQAVYNALNLALSSILVRVSNQESDTRYAAVEKKITTNDVYKLFENSCEKLLETVKVDKNAPKVSVINKDVLKIDKSDISSEIGLVITSPPYPNAYEYWLYHKYRMWWLGYDPVSVKESEIGARAHFFKKNHHTEMDFYHQMSKTLLMIDNVLIKDGYIAIVVGRSKIHGKLVDNALLIEEAAKSIGLMSVGKFNRVIKSSRKSFNLNHANIKEETIVVLKK